eukprot:gene17825-19606_t
MYQFSQTSFPRVPAQLSRRIKTPAECNFGISAEAKKWFVVMSAAHQRLLDNNFDSPTTAVQVKMPRICGPKLSTCCFVLSIWGIVMLNLAPPVLDNLLCLAALSNSEHDSVLSAVLLGIFFKVQSVALTEDIPHFVTKVNQTGTDGVTKGYDSTATNCFIAAAIYVVTFAISAYQSHLINIGLGSSPFYATHPELHEGKMEEEKRKKFGFISAEVHV